MTKERPSCLLVCRTHEEYLDAALKHDQLVESLACEFLAIFATESAQIDYIRHKHRLGRIVEASNVKGQRQAPSSIALLDAASRAMALPEDGAACIIKQGDEAALLGAAHAVLSRKRLFVLNTQWVCSDFIEVARRASSITFVLSGRLCAQEGWNRLIDILRAHGISEPLLAAWGVLTASTPCLLSEIISRLTFHYPVSHEDRRLFEASVAGPNVGRTAEVQLDPHPDQDKTPGLAGARVPLGHYVGHGRSYCALGGKLCGLPSPVEAGSPKCIGPLECIFREGARTPANELRCDVAVVESCNVASFRHLGPTDDQLVNLAVRMLEGHSVAVISPYCTQVLWPPTPNLVATLGREGLSVGRICAILNASIVSRANAVGTFVLIGDPEAIVYAPPYRATRHAVARRTAPDSWEVSLRTSEDTVELYSLQAPNPLLSASSTALHVCSDLGSGPAPCVEFLRTAENRMLLLVTWEESPGSRDHRFVVTTEPPIKESLVVGVATTLHNVQTELTALHGRALGEVAGNLAFFAELERSLTWTLYSDTGSSAAYRGLHALGTKIERDAFNAQETLIGKLLDLTWQSGFWAFRHYSRARGIRFISTHESPAKCPRCGSRILLRSYQVGISPKSTRVLMECERCMLCTDYPDGGASVFLHGPEDILPGQAFEMTMKVSVSSRNALMCVAGLAFDALDVSLKEFSISPSRQQRWCTPLDGTEFSFAVTFSPSVPRQIFNAQGILLVNGALSWCLARVRLGQHSTTH